MANLDQYGLRQMKLIMHIVTSADDSTLLSFLEEAVYDVDAIVGLGMSVTISGSAYTLSPAPATTAALWNVLAWRGVFLFDRYKLGVFHGSLDGASVLRDAVMSISRGQTMTEMRFLLDRSEKSYNKVLAVYLMSSSSPTMDEMGEREPIEGA